MSGSGDVLDESGSKGGGRPRHPSGPPPGGRRRGPDVGVRAAVVVALAVATVLAVPAPAVGLAAPADWPGGGTAPVASAATTGPTGSGSAAAATATTISSCTTISSPGVYVLTGRIDTSKSSCINITTGGVVLDGAGNTINMSASGGGGGGEEPILLNASETDGGDGNGTEGEDNPDGDDAATTGSTEAGTLGHTGGPVAVNVSSGGSFSNVTVEDLTVRNVSVAVHGTVDAGGTGTGLTVRNVTTRDVTDDAVFVEAFDGATVRAVRARGNDLGADGNGFEIDSDHPDTTVVDVVVAGNAVDTIGGEDAVEFDADDPRTLVQDVLVANNTLDSGSEGLIVIADDSNGTVQNVSMRNNDVSADDEGVEIDVDGPDSVVERASVVGNALTVTGNEGVLFENDAEDAAVRDVLVADNDVSAEDGIEFESDGSNRTVLRNVSVVDNAVEASGNAIYLNGDADPVGVVEDVLIARNDITGSPSDGFDFDYDSFGFRGPVRNVTVVDNTLSGVTDAGIEFEPTQDRVVIRDVVFENNTFSPTTASEGALLEMDGNDNTLEVALVDNVFTGVSDGVDVDVDGDNQTVDLDVVGNEIGADSDGIYISDVRIRDAADVQFTVRGNDVRGPYSDGVDLDIDGGPGPAAGTLVVEGNDIGGGTDAIDVDSGPPDGVEIHYNDLSNNTDEGVDYANTSDGVWVDATDNYWGAPDGPGTDVGGPPFYADPVSGALADGAGTDVTGNTTTGVSNVHFDPFFASGASNFTVGIVGTNSPVTVGATVNVTARVRNAGPGIATQRVTLSADSGVRDATNVTIAGNDSTTVTLSWATDLRDVGTYRVSVATANDTASTLVSVEPYSFGAGSPTDRCQGDAPPGDNPNDNGENAGCRESGR